MLIIQLTLFRTAVMEKPNSNQFCPGCWVKGVPYIDDCALHTDYMEWLILPYAVWRTAAPVSWFLFSPSFKCWTVLGDCPKAEDMAIPLKCAGIVWKCARTSPGSNILGDSPQIEHTVCFGWAMRCVGADTPSSRVQLYFCCCDKILGQKAL